MVCSKVFLRGNFIEINAHIKKKRKTANKQPDFTPPGTKTETIPKVGRRKEITSLFACCLSQK